MKIKLKKILKRIVSLRFFTCIAIVFCTMISVAVTGKLIISGYEVKSVENLVIKVKEQANLLAADIASSQYMADQSAQNVNSEIEQLAYIYSTRIVVVNTDFRIVKDTYLFEEGKTLISPEVINAYSGKVSTTYFDNSGYVEIVMPIYSSDNSKIIGVIGLTITDTEIDSILEYFNRIMTVIFVIFLIIAIGMGILLAELQIRPLNKLNDSIKSVSSGAKESSVEARSLWEYNRISESVNVMLERINMLDQSRQEFVSNVSHELKTPMTSMKVLADSLVSQEDVPVEMYREFMQDIVQEIDRENQIISSLLTMVKLDKSKADMNVTTINVNELIELILKRLRPIAVQKNVELVLESFRPVAAELDEVKFTLAITNLVENAIKYNIENGWVHVSVNADHKFFYIKVADSGIGIPTNCKEQIFERFYRVDKARSRETGGTGLGLSITKSVILMHKGTIKLYSKENEGTTFTVRIPLYFGQGGGEQ